jgi:hypothetical protein
MKHISTIVPAALAHNGDHLIRQAHRKGNSTMSYPPNWMTDEAPAMAPPGACERDGLPGAIHALDDHELRVLLIALLQEWRGRTEMRGGHIDGHL